MGETELAMITAEQERSKYARMWAVPKYRASSPGQRLVPHFLKAAHPEKGQTLIDIGCGTGRAAMDLQHDGGLIVAGLDITRDCLDPMCKKAIPFIEACLWDTFAFTALGPFDWFYCCDVLEHIPEEHVDAALDNMRHVANAGFIQIAMHEENFGAMIGETLHLTIKPREWWLEKLAARWTVEDLGDIEWRRLCAIVR